LRGDQSLIESTVSAEIVQMESCVFLAFEDQVALFHQVVEPFVQQNILPPALIEHLPMFA
jgi:hypothetical protein